MDVPDRYYFQGYRPPEPGGDVIDLVPDFQQWAREAGLTQRQAELIYQRYTARTAAIESDFDRRFAEQEQADAADFATQSALELEGLKGEWGQEYHANVAAAQGAARRLGVEQATLDKIERAVGSAEMLRIFAKTGRIASAQQQAAPPQPGGSAPPHDLLGWTPEAANQRIRELKNDPAFVAKYTSGDAAAGRQIAALVQAASASDADPSNPVGVQKFSVSIPHHEPQS